MVFKIKQNIRGLLIFSSFFPIFVGIKFSLTAALGYLGLFLCLNEATLSSVIILRSMSSVVECTATVKC